MHFGEWECTVECISLSGKWLCTSQESLTVSYFWASKVSRNAVRTQECWWWVPFGFERWLGDSTSGSSWNHLSHLRWASFSSSAHGSVALEKFFPYWAGISWLYIFPDIFYLISLWTLQPERTEVFIVHITISLSSKVLGERSDKVLSRDTDNQWP